MSKIIKLGQYKNVEVAVEKITVTAEQVEQQLTEIVASRPTMIEKNGAIESGDIATFDFAGFKGEEQFEGGTAENFELEIGSGQFIPGFEDQMIGMNVGESKDINVTFPEQYPAENLAGQPVVFKVTVHKISQKKDSELTDEFVAAQEFPNAKTVEELRNLVKSGLEAQAEQQNQINIENTVLGAVIDASEVEADEAEIQAALDLQLGHMQMQMAQNGISLDQYIQMMGMNKEQFIEQIKPNAKKQAEFEAIIDEIVRVENIVITDEAANAQIEMIAKANGVEIDDVKKQVKFEEFKRDLARMEASKVVLDTAIIK